MHEPDHARFMRVALDEAGAAGADGNLPVGAVIVRAGEVVGVGRNSVRASGDPTAHAEIAAIRDACRRLGALRLEGATLYATTEPCPMCLWAICATGVARLVLGARHATFVRPELGDYAVERLLALTGAHLEVVTGVLEAECEATRTDLERR